MWLLIFVGLEIESTWHLFSCSLSWLHSQLHSLLIGKLIVTYVFPRALLGDALVQHLKSEKPSGYPIWSQQAEGPEDYNDLELLFRTLSNGVESLKGKVGTTLSLCWKKSLRLISEWVPLSSDHNIDLTLSLHLFSVCSEKMIDWSRWPPGVYSNLNISGI